MEEGVHVAIAAEKLGNFLGLPITNTLITSWAVVILLCLVAIIMRGKLKMMPGRFQTLLEEMFGYVYDYVTEILGSSDLARKFFPLLMTIFLFAFTSNMLEFLPGVGSFGFSAIGGREFIPLFRSVNTDLNVPLALAIISFLVVEITGILAVGALKYGKKFLDLRGPMNFAVGIVEFVGEIVRVVSLSFRLFGNILAGEIVLAVAIFFVPYLAPLPLMMFELFIGTLQAAIVWGLTLFRVDANTALAYSLLVHALAAAVTIGFGVFSLVTSHLSMSAIVRGSQADVAQPATDG